MKLKIGDKVRYSNPDEENVSPTGRIGTIKKIEKYYHTVCFPDWDKGWDYEDIKKEGNCWNCIGENLTLVDDEEEKPMKLKDKIKKLNDGCEKEVEQYLEYTQLGTILNLLEDGVEEVGDEKLIGLWREMQTIIQDKRESLFETDVAETQTQGVQK